MAGWPGGRNWIDSSSLLLRLQLPAILFKNAEFAVALKQDENDIAPNLTKAQRTVRPGTGAHLPLGPLQQPAWLHTRRPATGETQFLPAANTNSARKPTAGAASRRSKRTSRGPAHHAHQPAEFAGVPAQLNDRLPSFFKEGMFEPRARTGVVALVEPKVGVANDTRTIHRRVVRPSFNDSTTPAAAEAAASPP
ncbi:hypothetical protein ACFQT0_05320 [Hymenobacter humi]|uniref:Uncharacterized protein n=1 Tax=Hymenobacter humi TaxID=1411620 RepID=A0ABW2U265_9BACT